MANPDGPWVRFFASDWLAGTRGMTAAETGVYITLIATMYEHGAPIPRDNTRLARVCGLPTRNFCQILDRLIETNKILVDDLQNLWGRKVETEVRNRSARAERGRLAAQAKHEQNQRPKPAKAVPEQPPSTSQTVPRARVSEPEPDSKVITLEEESSSQPSAARLWWDEFWAMFPNKVGKADAVKAFDKARKRVDRPTMIEGLQRYVDKTDDRPWCNPSTWLNQDRWADQPAQAPPRHNGHAPRQTHNDVIAQMKDRIDEHDAKSENDARPDRAPPGRLSIAHQR